MNFLVIIKICSTCGKFIYECVKMLLSLSIAESKPNMFTRNLQCENGR
jgi:amino acid permease